MPAWMFYSLLVIVLWGIVGLFQKLGTNRVSADSLLFWLMVGYVLLLPWLLATTSLSTLRGHDMFIGTLAGITNASHEWTAQKLLGGDRPATNARSNDSRKPPTPLKSPNPYE